MVRTQVYLTDAERDGLAALAKMTGQSQSGLIREAVDRLIERYSGERREAVLDRAAGLWRDRDDLSDLRALRDRWDRG